jgi:hypothetical protein
METKMTTATETKKAVRLSRIFNGTVTLVNNETQTHCTLKINTVQQGRLKGKRIVSRLVGTDNENSYKGFAFVVGDMIMVWRKQHNAKNAKIASILQSLMVEGEKSRFAELVDMKLSKKCMRCNRKLTTPESIEEGIGPICRDLGGF